LVFGVKRSAVIARELTKMHESVYRGTLAQLRTMLTLDENMARGEIVLLVAGEIATGETGDWPLLQRVLPLLLKDLPPARSAAIAAKLSGVDRDTVYREALKYSETR
jgi:16S rRNA (cytidine1402-2'-O)-methyltransferase